VLSQEQVKVSVLTAPCIVVFQSTRVQVLVWAQLDECPPDYVLLLTGEWGPIAQDCKICQSYSDVGVLRVNGDLFPGRDGALQANRMATLINSYFDGHRVNVFLP